LSAWRRRLAALRSPSVLLRILADILLIQATLVSAAAAEVIVVAAGVNVDVLEAGSANRMVLRWLSVLAWWLIYVPVVTVALLYLRGVYTVRRGNFLEKASQIALVGGLHFIAWVALVAIIGEGVSAPRFGSMLALATVPIVLVLARAILLLLSRGGVVPAMAPRRDHRTPIQTVLIIGGAGYIGSVLARILLNRGYRVRVLDSLIYGDDSLAALNGAKNFELRRGDGRDLSNLVAAAHGADAVVHLAAIVGDPACELDHDLTLEINLLATRTTKEVATALGVKRLIFASTCSVYGAAEELVDESSKAHPVSLYGRTKLLSEQLLLAPDQSGLCTTVLRFATIYGLSPRPRFDLVVNLFTAQAFTDGRITVHGGSQWRPLLHVRDAARAIVSALEAPVETVDHQIFNIGAEEENYTIAQVAEHVSSVVRADVILREDVPDARTYKVSFEKARRLLDFRPTVTLDEGINELVEALRTGLVKDYRLPAYSNVLYLTTTVNAAHRRDKQLLELAELA
jgi:nucleoside-diphosphate-sugar epimerase